ncbi:penicillin-binding transpeptidase domain-containing protein [Desulfoluna spongiiphila]|uniref:penicillin-binding transpeptidase domain-containing protein n=1 Tax=Desulfoluna spongiiphila TaxID=419481 RepID=UPI001258585C|nr:penicillin-binding transpeptidase domain-containing protein [Desulfoluna spongiiphila]VVS94730.1 consensus disorder prediction [Desulfoluna spongiiphila]
MRQQKQDWRAYQQSLKQRQKIIARSHTLKKGVLRGLAGGALAALVIALAVTFAPRIKAAFDATPAPSRQENPNRLTQDSLRGLLDPRTLAHLDHKKLQVTQGDKELTLTTTLDLELQALLINEFKRNIARKRGTPRYVAAVAVDPATGRILSMAGFSKEEDAENPSLEAAYPAASIFKIITASAATEKLGLTPRSTLSFNGGKYTLYKRQLNEKKNKYTNTISFRDSFAQSVNPVFGKLGALKLKKENLSGYAERFLFNQEIAFDLPVEKSTLAIGEDPYQWAEVACGFNRITRISPLHGALIGATAVTGGNIPAPYLVDSVVTAGGQELTVPRPPSLGQAVPQKVSSTLNELMQRTIRSGTARKSFAGYRRDPVLKNLTLGGKTGSISNKARDVRVDWFVGFAKENKTGRSMAIAVVVGHQAYIGTRASAYARKAITCYFSHPPESPRPHIADTQQAKTPNDS